MGGVLSGNNPLPPEQNEDELIAASIGALPFLRSAFARLSRASTGSSTVSLPDLLDALSLKLDPTPATRQQEPVREEFVKMVPNIGPSIVELFFSASDEAGLSWLHFVRGYNHCCARPPGSAALGFLFKLYSRARELAGAQTELDFSKFEEDGKICGSLSSGDLTMILWMCYAMGWRCWKGPKGGLLLPDVSHLVLSMFSFNGMVQGVSGFDVMGSEMRVPVQKVNWWALSVVPRLAQCLSKYLLGRFQACGMLEEEAISSGFNFFPGECDAYLLTCVRAWAISLTSWDEEINNGLSDICFRGAGFDVLHNVLYRSSIHGNGLSRFWSFVEGYDGPLLTLIHARSTQEHDMNNCGTWIVGMLAEDGFENRDKYYGNSGCLYAISPSFNALSPSGNDGNFIYCHLHPTVKVYEPHPKPVGLAFGGKIGNERIFIDEDFSRVTIRHHAVDKTYKHGSLVLNQGYLPVEASILGVEVWGFGGKTAQEHQNAFKRRETLFLEQRRKVDLKTFGAWDDSPEKLMMDMMSDPNRVRREER